MNTITNSFWWRMQWDKLRYLINPRQKWLIKKIPKHWVDCDGLLEICIFESFKHFVEQEDGLESIWGSRYVDDEYSEAYRQIREPIRIELEEIYEYVKSGRSILQKELDESYPESINGGDIFDRLDKIMGEDGEEVKCYQMKSCEEIYGKPYKETYAEVHRLEALIEEKDTWAMTGIIKNRQSLWT
jgi:hypothetical protein